MNRWPKHNPFFWETAPFFRMLAPLAAGIFLYDRHRLHFLAGSVSFMVMALALLSFTAITSQSRLSAFYKSSAFILFTIAILGLGYTVAWYGDVRNDPHWFGNNIANTKVFVARVTDVPSEKENSWKVPVAVINTVSSGKVSGCIGNAFVYLYKDDQPMLLHKGDTALLPSKWQPIANAGNPFEFNYAKYCGQNNLYYQQSCSAKDIRLYATGEYGDASFTERAHDWCMRQLAQYINDHKTKGLVQAMLLGDEVNLDEDLLKSYADTGIVHIIAISGGNVAIFFVAISVLLWWLKDKKHLWIKYAVAVPLVWFYVLMAGAAPSAIRAAIMFSILAFSVMLRKDSNSLNTLFATAFLLLVAEPMWLFSLGFQLSFVAVLSIVLFYKPIRNWLPPMPKLAMLLWETVAASIAAEILVAPLIICYFHTFPILFIIANVAAYLFMSIVLFLSMGIILLSWVPIAAHAVGVATVWLVTVFDKFISYLQGLNPASFHFLMLTDFELLFVYVAVSGIAVFLLRKKKTALFASLTAICCMLTFLCHDEWVRLHQQRLVVYNIGRANRVELIRGTVFSVIGHDTTAGKKIDYVVKPAHTNWRAWQQDTNAVSGIIYIKGKTALILDHAVASSHRFHVDDLIVNYPCERDIANLKNTFSPSIIVLANNIGRREQEAIVKKSAGGDIPIFSVSQKGAFVLD